MNIHYLSLRNEHFRKIARQELVDELGDWWYLCFSTTEKKDPVWCARQIPRIKANRKIWKAELDKMVLEEEEA